MTHKNQFHIDKKNFNVGSKTVKLSEDILGEHFFGFRTKNNYLNNTLKAFTIKRKVVQLVS